MINREITYQRDVNKSYMKIPAVIESCLDEKLIFRKDYQGILPVEKCYVNGAGQYWYNISGRQALDTYCRVNSISHNFFEMLILRICSQLEILEWNLIDTSCLVVDPELIFVNSTGEDVSFVLYPDTKGNFWDELQQLLEYLLTKLNHTDPEGVRRAYRLYDLTLAEGYSIAELKETILTARERKIEEETLVAAGVESTEEVAQIEPKKEVDVFQDIEKKLQGLLERVKEILWVKKENKEDIPMVVYPEDEVEEEENIQLNPTICLAASLGAPRGILVYEGMGDYPDFVLEQGTSILGKNPRARLHINRETISQFHAKLDYYEKNYYIEDMNSTNGTFLNDEMLNYKEKKMLSAGDVIRFADVKYRFM